MTWEKIIGGIDFGEGPRWHDGRLWFSDFHQGTISSVGDDGERRIEVTPGPRPSGLGWLPDGRLVFVSMLDRRVMRVEQDGSIVVHADLSSIATGNCNDMVVSTRGFAYVGNFGFDLEAGESLVPAVLAIVRPDGAIVADERGLAFPNGSVITPDGQTLIVGETFAGRYTAFDIREDGLLGEHRVWAEIPGSTPDGCTSDAEGAIWFSDAQGQQVVRVREGGEVTDRIDTPDNTYACMLGGDDGATLFVLTSVGGHPDHCAGTATGALWTTTVDVPRDPLSLP